MTNLFGMCFGFLMVVTAAAASGCTASSSESADDPPTKTAEAVEPDETFQESGGLDSVGLLQHSAHDVGAEPAPHREKEKQFPGISFVIPASWKEQELSEALKVVINSKYTIPHTQGDVELTMTTMGGGAEENIQRWIDQMQIAPGEKTRKKTIDIDGVATSWVDVRGTYSNRVGQKKGPFPGWRLVGVVIPNQPKDFMLKLIGPREAIADLHDEFVRVVKTAKFDRQ